MSRHYTNPERESDPHALPDIEVFQMTAIEVAASAAYEDEQYEFLKRPEFRLATMNSCARDRMLESMVAELGIEGGYFYWHCLPGCLPDGPPMGPYATHAEAVRAAQEDVE